MGFESLVLSRLQSITNWINSVKANAKQIDELPVQENLVVTSKLHISNNGVSESLEISKIINSTISEALGTWRVIDGFLVNKRSNTDFKTIEKGDFIKGDFGSAGSETTRVIEANVVALPYTNENNLEILESNRVL